VSIFDLLEDAVITRAGEDRETEPQRPPPKEEPKHVGRRRRRKRAAREAEARAVWGLAARRKAAIEPGVRAVEILALLREMSLLRRWDARGRLRAIERFRRRVDESDVRRYIADVRGMVRGAEGRPTAVANELMPQHPAGSDGSEEGSA
jgi:hypothetical protein